MTTFGLLLLTAGYTFIYAGIKNISPFCIAAQTFGGANCSSLGSSDSIPTVVRQETEKVKRKSKAVKVKTKSKKKPL